MLGDVAAWALVRPVIRLGNIVFTHRRGREVVAVSSLSHDGTVRFRPTRRPGETRE
jgi:hypothetical protein